MHYYSQCRFFSCLITVSKQKTKLSVLKSKDWVYFTNIRLSSVLPSKRQHSKLLLNGQLPKPSSRCQWRLDSNISSPHVPAFLQELLQVACLVATNKIPNTKQNKGILACFLNYPHTAELFKYVGGGKSMAGYFLHSSCQRDKSNLSS